MSDKPTFHRDAALAVAMELRDRLEPLCVRIEIAGSIRRMKREVHDVEILYVPRLEDRQSTVDMFSHEMVSLPDEQLDKWLGDATLIKRLNKNGIAAWGKQNKLAVHVPSGIAVDFFATDAERWFVSLVIRTGGKDTNLKLTTGAQQLGRKLHAYGQGLSMPNGDLVPCRSEQEVFAMCGVPYKDPWERE